MSENAVISEREEGKRRVDLQPGNGRWKIKGYVINRLFLFSW